MSKNKSLKRDPSFYKESYLHRKFLHENSIVNNAGNLNIKGTEAYVKELEKEITFLKKKEDQALINLHKSISSKERGSAQQGWKILNEILIDSTSLNMRLFDELKDFNQKGLNADKKRDIVMEGTYKAMQGTYNEIGIEKTAEEVQNQVIKIVEDIVGTEDGIGNWTPGVLIGRLLEKLDVDLFNDKFIEEIENQKIQGKLLQADFIGDMVLEVGGRGTGKLISKFSGMKGVKSMPDMVITMSEGDLPISKKAKTTSKSKTANILAQRKLSQLVTNKTVGEAGVKFLKVALIHQHYWGYGPYRNRVMATWAPSKNGSGNKDGVMPSEFNPSGATQFAIEAMDAKKTIPGLRPAVDIMREAFAINLFLGFEQNKPNLFTMISGSRNANGKNAIVVRSSEVLETFKNFTAGKGKSALKFSGLAKGGNKFYKEDVSLSKENMDNNYKKAWQGNYQSTEKWADYAETQFDKILDHTVVITDLNYAGLLKARK